MNDEITITREGAQWLCDKYVKADQANREVGRIVGGLLWHIEVMMDYDCDQEIYEKLCEIRDVLSR